jgi:hypothetical protein
MQESQQNFPDSNRLSVLIAAILLAYALAALLPSEPVVINLNLLGLQFALQINTNIWAGLLAAGLASTGMDWLLRGHPRYAQMESIQHLIVPALTALVIGVPLYNLEPGPAWWLSFVIGGLLLLLVFVAEYILLDPSDLRFPAASASLTALSFALFLILAAVLEFIGARLVIILFVIPLAAGMVTLRAIHLRSGGRWEFQWALGAALVCGQLAAALHYWPVHPLQYGLATLGPLYALTALGISQAEQASPRYAQAESLVILAALWAAALFLRI